MSGVDASPSRSAVATRVLVWRLVCWPDAPLVLPVDWAIYLTEDPVGVLAAAYEAADIYALCEVIRFGNWRLNEVACKARQASAEQFHARHNDCVPPDAWDTYESEQTTAVRAAVPFGALAPWLTTACACRIARWRHLRHRNARPDWFALSRLCARPGVL